MELRCNALFPLARRLAGDSSLPAVSHLGARKCVAPGFMPGFTPGFAPGFEYDVTLVRAEIVDMVTSQDRCNALFPLARILAGDTSLPAVSHLGARKCVAPGSATHFGQGSALDLGLIGATHFLGW